MKLKTIFHRAAAGVLCLLICAAGLCQSAFAAGLVRAQPPITGYENKASYSLTIQYKPHWNSGAQFRLYKVASVDKNVKFTLTDQFKPYVTPYGLDLNKMDDKYDWDGLADYLHRVLLSNTAISYTAIGKLSRTAAGSSGVTATDRGSYAELTFSGLYPGLYLVVGDSYEWREPLDGKIYTYTPNTYLVCVPNWSYNEATKQYEWARNVVADARAKAAFTTDTTKSYLVFKKWEDNKNAGNTRPQNIQVALYRNGTVIRTGILSAANNWTLSWTGLPVTGLYWAREVSVPAGYRNTENNDFGNTVTEIVNAYRGGGGGNPPSAPVTPPSYPVTPPSAPVTPSSAPGPTPPPVEIDDPDVPLGNVTPPPTRTDPPEEIELDDPDVPLGDLPQTGQLWWPVPVLIVAGIVLVLIGIVRRRTGEYYDE